MIPSNQRNPLIQSGNMPGERELAQDLQRNARKNQPVSTAYSPTANLQAVDIPNSNGYEVQA